MSSFAFENVDSTNGIPEVEPADVFKNLGKFKIVDVRTNEEFQGELGHIEDAVLLPIEDFPAALEELSLGETYVFVCRSGGRSGRVTELALNSGFEQVYNMRGGMLLWNKLGLETK